MMKSITQETAYNKLKCIIVEDEPLAQRLLISLIDNNPFVDLIGTAFTVSTAQDIINKEVPDIIFLDINLPLVNGFEFLDSLRSKEIMVIITTADGSYALKAFDYNPIHFIQKPITFEKFSEAVNRAISYYKVRSITSKVRTKKNLGIFPSKEYLVIPERITEKIIHFSEILYIEGSGDYPIVHTSNYSGLLNDSLSKCETLLPSPPFFRIHKRFIVNADAVTNVFYSQLTLKNYIKIDISNYYITNIDKLKYFINMNK